MPLQTCLGCTTKTECISNSPYNATENMREIFMDLAHRSVQPNQSSGFFRVRFRLLVISRIYSERAPRISF